MTDTEFKLIEAQITGLQALFQANFDVLNDQNKELIKHQKVTNGRINSLESVRKEHSAQLVRVLKIQDLQNEKGIKFLLWFSTKKYRLLLVLIPFYLFTIKEIRDIIFDNFEFLIKLMT